MKNVPLPRLDKSPEPGAQTLRDLWPWLAILAVAVTAVVVLRGDGRLWWCACGQLSPWSWDVWSSHNSQHLIDPYSFTHMLHGVVFCGILAWACPLIASAWRLVAAVALEALWEIVENSPSFLASKHRAEGVQCQSCHNPFSPTAAPTNEACLACHAETYAKLVALTTKISNPHNSHLGEIPCWDCHRGHEPFKPTCLQCHTDASDCCTIH